MEEYDRITDALKQLENAKERYSETIRHLESARDVMREAKEVVESLQNTVVMPLMNFLNKVIENDLGYSVLDIIGFANESLIIIALGRDEIATRCYLKTENGQPFSEFFAKNNGYFKAYINDGTIVLTEMSAGEKALKEV